MRIWSRETGSAVPSRISLPISILRLNLVLTYEIPPEFRGGVHVFIYNRDTSLSGHAIAYRWRSLPRVRRHGASKPQGRSERVLPWQVTMEINIRLSFPHPLPAIEILGCCCCCCCFLTLTDPLRIQPWSQDRRNQTKSNRESEMSMESRQKRTDKK